eukprot:855974-Rhodomonas_salina.1
MSLPRIAYHTRIGYRTIRNVTTAHRTPHAYTVSRYVASLPDIRYQVRPGYLRQYRKSHRCITHATQTVAISTYRGTNMQGSTSPRYQTPYILGIANREG